MQDFLATPQACTRLLRDLLAEQPGSRQRLLELLRFLHAEVARKPAAGGGAAAAGVGGRGQAPQPARSLASGAAAGPALGIGPWAAEGAAGSGGAGGLPGSCSAARVALAAALHLYCHVDSVQAQPSWREQHHKHEAAPKPASAAAADAAVAAKLLRSCVQLLAELPVVPGCWGRPVCTLRPLRGCTQLSAFLADPALKALEYLAGAPPAAAAIEAAR